VVDVGIHRLPADPELGPQVKARLCGDVRAQEVEPLASALTPVPGGVGPMTVTMLLVNTVARWQQHCGLPFGLRDLLL
ncbi:MAG: bifunctional 5,10-methylene-tetrahydrofolate dehydrogenase/5,10-methylene-tetrahydrofolate cyclohydrolase, partial [Cyanobacteriota bacterium]|nr:bifunctional 5,10-methylene-tetrahydrofolate dehydrogenase/5,10-methylene-tetrahydrofolate cyclohydrolase [Cyanobacteriota bacterium]